MRLRISILSEWSCGSWLMAVALWYRLCTTSLFTCGYLCCVCGLISLSSRFFAMILICGVFQALFFFLSLVLNLNFFTPLYLLLPVDLIFSQAHI